MVLSWLMPYFASRDAPTGNVRLNGIAFERHGWDIHAL